MRGRRNKKGGKGRRLRERGEMRRARAASLRRALDEWEEEGPCAAKKIHIKVKRGKPDGVTRSKGEAAEREGEERQEEEGRSEREREALVASLRVLFLLPCSGSALMFSLLRLSYPPFDFSYFVGISTMHLAILPFKQRTQRNARTVYIEKIENYTSV